jgi:SecD/SecF fusion protein
MDKSAIWKWLILVVLVVVSCTLIAPKDSSVGKMMDGLGIKSGIGYGLDIRGGVSFVVKIDEEQIRDQLKGESPDITVSELDAKVQKALEGSQARSLEVIRNRIDTLGLSEPVIYPGKDNTIVIQLPGISTNKQAEAEDAIRRVAFLEFRVVHKRSRDLIAKLFEKVKAPDGYKIAAGGEDVYVRDIKAVPDEKMDSAFHTRQRQFGQDVVRDAEYEFLLEKDVKQGLTIYRPYFVKRRAELTGDLLKSARVDYKNLGTPVIDIEFDSRGAKKFASITSDYAPGGAKNPDPNNYYQLAIVLDGTLYSAPRINEAIYGGRAEISGSFTPQEAILLANILNAGSLPAPVKIMERRIVDPTLGTDAVNSGIKAGVYGCVAIVVLMAGYYLLNGLLADFALILNVVLLPLGAILVAGFLGMIFGGLQGGGGLALPVLTLPGIAGIALTIGMAVDTNVLILERMREELKSGKGFKAAVDAGFTHAFSAIFDSHVTTIISGIIMFAVGTGAIRGYSITLTAGLLINLYTAVFVTRMCYDSRSKGTPNLNLLKMFSLLGETSIRFISKWKIAIVTSWAIIIVSWAMMINAGLKDPTKVFGVDFTGGTSISLSFENKEKPSVEAIRTAIASAGVRDAMIQYQKAMEAGSRELLMVKVATPKEGKDAFTAVAEKFPTAHFTIMQQDDVGPQVGSDLKRKGMWAMVLALVAMVVYIAIRFEFGFGLGAVVATVHDVLMTVGVCYLAGFQFNMTILAAVLTIIGYSLNDTIVIFDRIRENLRKVQNKSFVEICDLSINETLARTLLTTFFTFISVFFLYFMGGGAVRGFSFAMLIGMISGIYSTVYIATPITLLWYRFKAPDMGRNKVQ